VTKARVEVVKGNLPTPCFSLYTKEGCEWCDKAILELDKLGLVICVFDVADETNKERLKSEGHKTVPQIWYHTHECEEYIGGYERLMKWLEDNKGKFKNERKRNSV
jgi:glutaredoxin